MTRQEMWERAYKSDRNAVRKMLLKYEDDYDLVDDLTQDTYIRALEHLDQWDEEATFLTWLVTIAENIAKDHVRKQTAEKRANEVLSNSITPAYASEEDEDAGHAIPWHDRTDLSRELAHECAMQDPYYAYEAEQSAEYAFAKLPGAARQPMRLRAEGFTNPEIAEMLGLSVSYVENLISRARKLLADGENREAITSNSVYSERKQRPVERFATQAELERAVARRFARRNFAFVARQARMRNPDATLAEWKETYDV
jgi:RNA polymerase sigma factor (sigma-70 family)